MGLIKWNWAVLSLALLLIYLGFFHSCLDRNETECRFIGVGFWLVWLFVCAIFGTVFRNPFEFWIHQLVGLDILLEGFNPFHEGYGFYVCALAFWGVLIANHVVTGTLLRRRKPATDQTGKLITDR